MSVSHSLHSLSLSGFLLVLCLEVLIQPVVGLSNPIVLNAVPNSTVLDYALGINCRGSSLCPSNHLAADYIGIMLSIINGSASCRRNSGFNCGPLKDSDVYKADAHIVCLPLGRSFLGGICAFAQGNVNGLGIFGDLVKRKLSQLSNHGCQVCGSVPLSDSNDPAEAGILTVNYISGIACPGLCPPTHYYADAPIETY